MLQEWTLLAIRLRLQFGQEASPPDRSTHHRTEAGSRSVERFASLHFDGQNLPNFSGPIAWYRQTGDRSQANVAQHLNSGFELKIVQVLQTLLDKIDGEPVGVIPRREELRELVVETKTKLKNPVRTRSSWGQISRTIRGNN